MLQTQLINAHDTLQVHKHGSTPVPALLAFLSASWSQTPSWSSSMVSGHLQYSLIPPAPSIQVSSQEHGPPAHLILQCRPEDALLVSEPSLEFESKLSTQKPTCKCTDTWFEEDTDRCQPPAPGRQAVTCSPAWAAHTEDPHLHQYRWLWEHTLFQSLRLGDKDPTCSSSWHPRLGVPTFTSVASVAGTQSSHTGGTKSPQHACTQEKEWDYAMRELRKDLTRW